MLLLVFIVVIIFVVAVVVVLVMVVTVITLFFLNNCQLCLVFKRCSKIRKKVSSLITNTNFPILRPLITFFFYAR